MRPVTKAVFCFAAMLGAVACDHGSAPGASSPGADKQCSAYRQSAQSLILDAIDKNQTCTTDADCEVVAFQSTCFDSCTRVMSVSGKAAYERARSEAEERYCSAYKAQGCPAPVVPPCAPNPPPSCKSGKCG